LGILDTNKKAWQCPGSTATAKTALAVRQFCSLLALLFVSPRFEKPVFVLARPSHCDRNMHADHYEDQRPEKRPEGTGQLNQSQIFQKEHHADQNKKYSHYHKSFC